MGAGPGFRYRNSATRTGLDLPEERSATAGIATGWSLGKFTALMAGRAGISAFTCRPPLHPSAAVKSL